MTSGKLKIKTIGTPIVYDNITRKKVLSNTQTK